MAPSPEGLKKGGKEYWKAKCESQIEISKRLFNREREIGPKAAGILEPKILQRSKLPSNIRITSGHGSSELSGLHELLEGKRINAEADTARKALASAERATKKAISNETAMAQLTSWHACRPFCTCPGSLVASSPAFVCPMACLVLCPFCDTLKKRKCGVGACKAAAQKEAAAETDAEAGVSGEEESDSEAV